MIKRTMAWAAMAVLLMTGMLYGQSTATATKSVKTVVNEITNHKHMKHAQWGFIMMDVESGKVLESRNADETLLPASTMKTVTSAAALAILGENYTFKTYLETDGEVVDGVLKGNVYIRGGGDPSLGSDRFKWGTDMQGILDIWVNALQKKGIERV
ncbi:MAG: D-alanyl-D-alanine carboxypeptidase, partial [Bacteroidota bacterium]